MSVELIDAQTLFASAKILMIAIVTENASVKTASVARYEKKLTHSKNAKYFQRIKKAKKNEKMINEN